MAWKFITFTDGQWYFTVQELLDFIAQQDMSVCFELTSCWSKTIQRSFGRQQQKHKRLWPSTVLSSKTKHVRWIQPNIRRGDWRDKESQTKPLQQHSIRFIMQAKDSTDSPFFLCRGCIMLIRRLSTLSNAPMFCFKNQNLLSKSFTIDAWTTPINDLNERYDAESQVQA